MLTASILKIFYWPGARYDPALLIQAIIMVGVQVVLLKAALANRPPWRGEGLALRGPGSSSSGGGGGVGGALGKLGVGFWRWKAERPYWEYLGLLTLGLWAAQTFIRPGPNDTYTQFIGYLGLAIEAFLPVPQILENRQKKSCKGFRVSVLGNWLVGDAMKMGFFFLSDDDKVPWAFKCCGMFQAACDAGLGLQWWVYGDGPPSGDRRIEMEK